MSRSADPLDALLRLGEQIAAAVEADDWSRVATLVERRGEWIEMLGAPEDSSGAPDRARDPEKVDALIDQNQRLTELLRDRRDEIEDELTQIEQMRHAQDSYDTDSSRSGVLPPELTG